MINEFIAYLDANTASFVSVGHAKDQKPVDDIDSELPLLGVFPWDDQAGADATDFIESKMVTSTVVVLLVCPIEDWETLKTELRTAAIGWSAGNEYTDLELISGSVMELKAGVMWWEERYSNRRVIREAY